MQQGEHFASLSELIESLDFITQLFKALDFAWGLALEGFDSDPVIHDLLRFTGGDGDKKQPGQTLVETTLKARIFQGHSRSDGVVTHCHSHPLGLI